MSGPKPIVVVGSINTDLVSFTARIPAPGETVLGSDFKIFPGGKGANQAVAIARLGYPVRMIGCVGNDSFGREAREHLRGAGVDVELVETVDAPSGTAVICVSTAGDNSIIVTPGANARLAPSRLQELRHEIKNAGAVLTQLETPLDTVENLAEICSRENIPLILDPAPAATLPESLFSHVAWFTPNQIEAAFYSGEQTGTASFSARSTAAHLLRIGVKGVLLKLGNEGAVMACANGDFAEVPAFEVKAIDTTAAGDAFNGGFTVALMKGMSVQESVRFAAAVAGISVTRCGAQPSMPTLDEVELFMAEQTARAL